MEAVESERDRERDIKRGRSRDIERGVRSLRRVIKC